MTCEEVRGVLSGPTLTIAEIVACSKHIRDGCWPCYQTVIRQLKEITEACTAQEIVQGIIETGRIMAAIDADPEARP